MQKFPSNARALTFKPVTVIVLIGGSILNFQPAKAQNDIKKLPPALQSVRQMREGQLETFPGLVSHAAEVNVVDASILTDEAVKKAANENHITATDDEVKTFLVPLLSRQGLIDVTKHVDIANDPNVKNWLAGQRWTFEDLLQTGRTMLLWTKLATKDVGTNEAEVKAYIAKHPELYNIPVRVQLSLTQFDVPDASRGVSHGVAEYEVLAPNPLTTFAHGAPDPVRKLHSKEWQKLELYLDLNQIDPVLRKELQGKAVGAEFGPVTLTNGAVVAGKVAAILPAVNLTESPALWQYAAILTRLDKVDQKDAFMRIANDYVTGVVDPNARGIFGDILGVVGTGVGALFGGVGAPVGSALGSVVGNWVDGQVSSPAPQPAPLPQPSPPPSYPSNPGLRPNYQPYYNSGPPPALPPVYRDNYFPMPSYPPYIPPMQPNFGNMYNSWQNSYASFAPPPPPFYPPVFMPMPMRFF